MKIRSEVEKKLPISDIDSYYVVADWDRTITSGNSKTSWSIISMCSGIPDSYIEEREVLYNHYRPIEIDEGMDFQERSRLVSEWYKKHIELFVKYGISEKSFDEAANDLRVMEFREGAVDFLRYLHENNIPLIIISAGIGNFIESFLKRNGCLYDNIYISSNKVIFRDGIAAGVSNNLIHSLNKNEVSLPEEIKERLVGRRKVLLLGDQISDLNMVDESLHDEVIKIGLYSTRSELPIEQYTDSFDIVCDDKEQDDYHVLRRVLFKK